MDVSALNLGMIVAYYNISCEFVDLPRVDFTLNELLSDVTVEVYTLSLKERTKLKGLLEVISSSAEVESIPVRRHEDTLLRRSMIVFPSNKIGPTLKPRISRPCSFSSIFLLPPASTNWGHDHHIRCGKP